MASNVWMHFSDGYVKLYKGKGIFGVLFFKLRKSTEKKDCTIVYMLQIQKTLGWLKLDSTLHLFEINK